VRTVGDLFTDQTSAGIPASIAPSPKTANQRQNSMDTFFDLARVSSNSVDGSDSIGENEIDFETLWQWPASHSTGLTPGGSGSEYFSKQPSLILNS
jgi:hypothetical protein